MRDLQKVFHSRKDFARSTLVGKTCESPFAEVYFTKKTPKRSSVDRRQCEGLVLKRRPDKGYFTLYSIKDLVIVF